MSLISFPISPNNIKEKIFQTATIQPYNPPGYFGKKAEYSYTVPSDRNSLLTLSFSFHIAKPTSGVISPVSRVHAVSFTDYLKAGDTVYSGVRVGSNNTDRVFYEVFYQLNGATLYSFTESNIVSATPNSDWLFLNHTVQSLQVDK